jgi:hypothetical protein
MDSTTAPGYPVQFRVDYPDRPLDRLTTGFRIIVVLPVGIVLAAVSGGIWQWSFGSARAVAAGAGGLLFFGPLLMIVFQRKYPRWWFDWNLELQRFGSRVAAYLALMTDRYPATDDQQDVHLHYAYPDVARDLSQWLPLVKWLLAVPHYLALAILDIAMIGAVIAAWFAIVFTGQYPRTLFGFSEGVIRWHNRVIAYAFTLATDQYPPFRLAPLPAVPRCGSPWRHTMKHGGTRRKRPQRAAFPQPAKAKPLRPFRRGTLVHDHRPGSGGGGASRARSRPGRPAPRRSARNLRRSAP